MKTLILISALAAMTVTGQAAAQSQPGGLDLAYRQRVEERLQGLDRQLRDATGANERLEFQLRRANQRIDKLEAALKALQTKVDGLEAASAAAAAAPAVPPPAAPAGAATSGPGGALPSGAAQAEYDAAFGLLRRGEFDGGEKAFRTFLARHPDHQLAGNARYWIAETLYARQRYQDAATAFLEAWQADVKGPKAPDNLLKLGLSLAALEKTNEACVSLAKLLNDYRGAPARIRTAATRERQSMNCG